MSKKAPAPRPATGKTKPPAAKPQKRAATARKRPDPADSPRPAVRASKRTPGGLKSTAKTAAKAAPVKPPRKRPPAKPKNAPPSDTTKARCHGCLREFYAVQLTETAEDGDRCFKCLDELVQARKAAEEAPPPPRKPRRTEMQWFVVMCDPSSDDRIKSKIRARARDRGIGNHVGRVIVPKERVAVIRGPVWKVWRDDGTELGHVGGEDIDEAIWKAEGRFKVDREGRPIVIGDVEQVKPGGRRVIVNRKLFPGYLICQLAWDDRLYDCVSGFTGVFGMLPTKPKLFGKGYGSGGVTTRKPKKWELEAHLDWEPVPLESEEAAMVMLREQIRVAAKAAKLTFEVGDEVEITGGPFAGMTGTVLSVDGDVAEPKIVVSVTVMGRPTKVTVAHYHLKGA